MPKVLGGGGDGTVSTGTVSTFFLRRAWQTAAGTARQAV